MQRTTSLSGLCRPSRPILAVLGALLFVPPAFAFEDPAAKPAGLSGVEVGLRVALELPAGDIDSGNSFRGASLSGVAAYRVPVWLDLGYRLSPPWWVGLGAQLGSGGFGDSCPDAAECEWTDVRLHGQALYHFAPGTPVDPWLGLALGWEWLRGSLTQTVDVPIDGENNRVPVKLRELRGGPQVLLQAGLRFALDEGLGIGPYVTAAAGQYVTDSFECPEGLTCDNFEADDSRVHAWFGLGVRGSYGP